ncbi:ATP-binding cassette domain-containing protein, partial [bacterium]|nr:ATP-binding cassette domain-containing protein [bacterium]
MLRFNNVSFTYPQNQGKEPFALRGVSFSLGHGEIAGLLGASGSGKSTLSRLAAGLLLPQEGSIFFDGLDLSSRSLEIHRKIGLLFQSPDQQIIGTTVKEDLAFGLENIGLSPTEIDRRISNIASQFGLIDLLETPPHLLSGGVKQELALAGVMIMEPCLLILDEPTSNLDPWFLPRFLDLLEKFRLQKGVSLLFISPHSETIRHIQRFLVLSEGKLVFDGNSRTLWEKEELGSWLLDAPEKNLLDKFLVPFSKGTDVHEKKIQVTAPEIELFRRPAEAPTFPQGGLKIQNLSAGYGKNIVLSEIDGEFFPGRLNLVVGPMGVGKTTLLLTLGGSLPILKGKIEADNCEWKPVGRACIAFQNPEDLFF